MFKLSSHIMVCVYSFQHAQGPVFNGVKPTNMGGRDSRWYGNRVNMGRAGDV